MPLTVSETSTSPAAASAPTCGNVNGDPPDVLAHDLHLARVEPDPYVHPQRSHLVDDGTATLHRTNRAIEGRQEAVADCLHLSPAEAPELSSDRLLQRHEQFPPAVISELRGAGG